MTRFARVLQWSNTAITVCNVFEGDDLPELDQADGVVVTGSSVMVTGKAAWSEATAAWPRARCWESAMDTNCWRMIWGVRQVFIRKVGRLVPMKFA